MKFETFLEDYNWFDKSHKVGTHYLNPTKRDASWLTPEKISNADQHYWFDLLDEHDDKEIIEGEIKEYKEYYTQSPMLLKFVAQSKLNRDYTLYRNFGSKIDVTKLKVGSTIPSVPGRATPTSLDLSVAMKFVGFGNLHIRDKLEHWWTARIVAKRGSPGFYPDIIESRHTDEKEILLGRDRLVVTGFSYVNRGKDVIHTVDCTV